MRYKRGESVVYFFTRPKSDGGEKVRQDGVVVKVGARLITIRLLDGGRSVTVSPASLEKPKTGRAR